VLQILRGARPTSAAVRLASLMLPTKRHDTSVGDLAAAKAVSLAGGGTDAAEDRA